jgi:hypothetical protein
VHGATGSTTLPVMLADLPDGVVWTPTTSATAGWLQPTGEGAVPVVRLAIPEGEPA